MSPEFEDQSRRRRSRVRLARKAPLQPEDARHVRQIRVVSGQRKHTHVRPDARLACIGLDIQYIENQLRHTRATPPRHVVAGLELLRTFAKHCAKEQPR